MKLRIALVISLLILLVLSCQSSRAQVSFVQGAPNTTSGGGPFPATATYGSSVTTGDLEIVWGRFFGGSAGISVVDSCGTTLTLQASGTNSSSYLALYTGTFACTGSNTITFSNGSGSIGSFPEFVGYQYHNGFGSGWTIGTAAGPTTGFQFNPWSTTSINANLDDLVLAFFENETGATPSPSGWPAGCASSVGCSGFGSTIRPMAGQDVFAVDNLAVQSVAWFGKTDGVSGGTVGYMTLNVTPNGLPTNSGPRQRQLSQPVDVSSPSSPSTMTFPVNVLANSGLFAFLGNNGYTITGCTDTLGTTFVQKIAGSSLAISGYQQDVWFGITTSGGADTVSCTFTSGGSYTVNFVVEVQKVSAFDQVNSTANNTSAPVNSGNITTSVANETLFGLAEVNTTYGNSPLTLGAGWSAGFIFDDPTNFAAQLYTTQEFNVTTGTYALSGTYPGFARNLSAIFSLEGINPGPTITSQPGDQSVTAPATATFSVTATSSGGSLSYQWKHTAGTIGGATSSSYTTGATSGADNGDHYWCTVTDSNGSIDTRHALLTVTTPPPTGSETSVTISTH